MAPYIGTEHRQKMETTEATSLEEYINPNAVAEVREALRRESSQHDLDNYQEQLGNIWSHPRPNYLRFSMWRPADRMLALEGHTEEEGNPFGEEHRFLNKATVFYWTESAQTFHGRHLLGAIWHTWFSASQQKPDALLDPFFATPVFIEENVAETVPEIVRAHKNVYAQLQDAQERLRTEHPGLKFKSDPRHFKLHLLCKALITIFDEFRHVAVEKRADGYRHCEDLAEKQIILLVRTGKEEKLSAPICFDSLKPYALPLSRNEDMETFDVVRVPLLVGVRFVADLLLREDVPFTEEEASTFPEPDHLPEAKEWRFRNWEKFRMGDIMQHGLSGSTAEEVKKKLHLDPDDQDAIEKLPIEFDCGWI